MTYAARSVHFLVKTMLAHTFKPGDEVPIEGVYRVHHYRHRLCHRARTKFLYFPRCLPCGEMVRFEPILILESCPLAPWLIEDLDFANATARLARKPASAGPPSEHMRG